MNKEDLLKEILEHLKNNFLADVDSFGPDSPLLTTRILDSISTLHLINFLEKHYGFEANASDISFENLDTPRMIADYVFRMKSN